MAEETPTLEAVGRSGTGKGAARKSRRDGMVPGIVYGGGLDPISIQFSRNLLLTKLKAGRFLSTLFNLKMDGQDDVRVICRAVQRDVVKDLPIHLDLMRIRRNSRINLFIPVEFINEDTAPGIKRGGVLTVVRSEIELVVTASDIPEKVTVDLTGLDIGDVITISSVTLPEGSKPTIERDFVVANISAPRGLAAEESSEEEAETDSSEEPEENTGE